MKRRLGPLVCALVAACSSHREPATSYDANATDQDLVPASSDAVEGGCGRPAPERDVERAPKGGTSRGWVAPGSISPAPEEDDAALTPIDQGNNEGDLDVTQRIRKTVVADDSLSFTAQNVKIITLNGKVTLRGAVKSPEEREKIAAIARRVAGAANVDNQLEVAK